MLDLKETEAQMASSDQQPAAPGQTVALVYGILHEAERTLHLLSTAGQDAQWHHFPAPANPQDYLA